MHFAWSLSLSLSKLGLLNNVHILYCKTTVALPNKFYRKMLKFKTIINFNIEDNYIQFDQRYINIINK